MGKLLPSSLIIMLITITPTLAETRLVPEEYSTIQAAIDNCIQGDTVIVSPGTYVEKINFSGRNIILRSTEPNDPDIVTATIIECPPPETPGRGQVFENKGSVVTFENGETSQAVLTGFTITGGYGTLNNSIEEGITWGGAVFCFNASPTITQNVIMNNNAAMSDQATVGYGGGIACLESNAIIYRNIIKNNTAYAGAGIMTYLSEPAICDNLIYGNSATIGGGVVLIGGNLINNTIAGNNADVIIDNQTGIAGNIYAVNDIETQQNLIVNNIICSATSGGGIVLNGSWDGSSFAFNNVWGNMPGNYIDPATINNNPSYDGPADLTGSNGNISGDPLFVDAGSHDYHLQMDSPCINAGDASFVYGSNDTDMDQEPRIYSVSVDIGAYEYVGYIRPIADAGPDQYISKPALVTFDGSGSFFYDPNGIKLFRWTQVDGPAVILSNPNSTHPTFMPEAESEYRFELIINDGLYDSYPDEVLIVVRNAAPIVDAGPDQSMSFLPPVITLDGSGSYDPQDDSLTYHWRQIAGPAVELSDINAVDPNFIPVDYGVYVFELVVNDGFKDSAPDTVGIVIGNRAPVADAGKRRYAAEDPVVLDGSDSFDPDQYGNLIYHWQQISGPSVTILASDTATPVITGLTQTNEIQRCVFELTVSDDDLMSRPDTVEVVIVPYYGTKNLIQANPPFDPSRPTIVAFGGGDCNIGGGLTMPSPSEWYSNVNFLTLTSYEPSYNQYGDVLIVFLSSVAPDYTQPIQTMGYSTGNMPAIDVAIHLNTIYADARYAVNRVSYFDTACRDYPAYNTEFLNSSVDGEMCWIDNYIATMGRTYSGTLNIRFPSPATHSTPVNWFMNSPEPANWPDNDLYNDGITAGYYLSVAGPGKNFRLAPDANNYYFLWNSGTNYLELNDESRYPARILEPVTLLGPEEGTVVDTNGVILSCEVSERAVGYQLLFGADPEHLNYLISDTLEPPQGVINTFPFETVYWTIKAHDEYGATIFADPARIESRNAIVQTIENIRTTKKYSSIQQAINDAAIGDEIVVSPGIYPHIENIDFQGKPLILRSIDPNDPAVVAATIITCDSQNTVVTFSGGEEPNCALAGFTITGGKNGIYCVGSSPTITNCNIIDNNTGIDLYNDSNPAISYCNIMTNTGTGIEMHINTLGRFKPYNHPNITNCIIAANRQYGISGDFPTITNCTICNNMDGGIFNSTSTVTNSIIYFNGDGTLAAQITGDSNTITYSDIQGIGQDSGNIDTDPLFADIVNGDYHLMSQSGRWKPASQSWILDSISSPCIDTGDPNSDIGMEPEPNGSIINIGAYGGTAQASMSSL
jgi:hypothetical protein